MDFKKFYIGTMDMIAATGTCDNCGTHIRDAVEQIDPEDIKIEVQKFLERINLKTINDLSYKISSEIDLRTIDRNNFPIIIKNLRKISHKLYEKVKIVLESYLDFNDKPILTELLMIEQWNISKYVARC